MLLVVTKPVCNFPEMTEKLKIIKDIPSESFDIRGNLDTISVF